MKKLLLAIAISGLGFVGCESNKNSDWEEYLGGPDRNHFSTLSQIDSTNVHELTIAWTYEMPDSGQTQASPIVIDGILFGVAAGGQAFALDAATGKQKWLFSDSTNRANNTNRGLVFWKNGNEKRILHAMGSFLYAIDPENGTLFKDFGINGRVDLHTGLPEIAQTKFLVSNTPGTIYEDLIIMPVRLSEESDAAPGDIRAFNVRTGKLEWTFHTIPYPGEFGYETFPEDAYKNTYTGAANNWAGMSVDRERGILFVPTGSAGYDFYGGKRPGTNLFANCLLALDAKTGKRLWHYQMMHHDIWDRDLPAPPNLLTVDHGGKKIDAVAQVTKQGYVFLFDRVNGNPLFPIEEVPAPKSDLEGETTWPTQPIPTLPKPYARQAHELTENDISTYAENRAELIARFKTFRKGRFDAPSKEGTVILPGFDGGAEWGGAAADPENGIIYINSNEMPWILTMKDRPKAGDLKNETLGRKTYTLYCAGCHGNDRQGNTKSGYPSLLAISKKRNRQSIHQIITTGKGMMPGFGSLWTEEKQSLIAYLLEEEKTEATETKKDIDRIYLPFQSTGYNKFLDNRGIAAISPPWGTLNAIDLNTGTYLWKVPFGNEPELLKQGIKNTGTENYGGPVITANGLLFIGASKDGMFRVYNRHTGKLLWETQLPAAGFATPATYMANGKQYIVIACGGGKLGVEKGNKYVAFALE